MTHIARGPNRRYEYENIQFDAVDYIDQRHGSWASPFNSTGPVRDVSAIGAGGMGEVYRARDTRLDRAVAIKILPSHLSSSQQARERFDREAKAISSLSHPHICQLYDVGHQDGNDFLVMEYLDGETLAGKLRKGPSR